MISFDPHNSADMNSTFFTDENIEASKKQYPEQWIHMEPGLFQFPVLDKPTS